MEIAICVFLKLLVFVSLTARTAPGGFALRFSFRRAKPTWAVAGEKVMVLKKTFFYDFRGLLIVRGGGGFLAVVGEIVMFPTMHC